MAKKGPSRHLKRYATARAIKLPRKEFMWTIKPAPGPHTCDSCLPIELVIRDYLKLARVAREADKILAERKILVDGKPRCDKKFPVGLMDVVSIPATGENYRVLLDHRKRLILHKIDQNETSFKLCKVISKNIVKGKKTQLTLHDGKTIVGEFNAYKRKDVVKVSIPKVELLERLPFEKGAIALITGGKNVSKVGKIIDIKLIESGQPNMITLEWLDGQNFQAPEDYVFVVGKDKPLISMPVIQ